MSLDCKRATAKNWGDLKWDTRDRKPDHLSPRTHMVNDRTPEDVKRLLNTAADDGDAGFRRIMAEIEMILTRHRGPA